MKTYMIGICRHISADIIIYWPIYEKINVWYNISTDICIKFENKNIHISLKKWKISTYNDQWSEIESESLFYGICKHISVNIKNDILTDIWKLNIDRYMIFFKNDILIDIFRNFSFFERYMKIFIFEFYA